MIAGGNGVIVRLGRKQARCKGRRAGPQCRCGDVRSAPTKIIKQGVSMASNEGGEPGRQLPDASDLGAASERVRPVWAREANLAAADEIAIWQAFALRWQTRSGRRLADRGRLLAVSVVLSPVLFCAVAAILLVASGPGLVGSKSTTPNYS